MRLAWRAQALDDLKTIIAYVAERNWPAAERLQAAIAACANALPAHPHAFRPGRVAGTRKAVVHRLEVVNVIHARQRYP